MKRNLPKPAMMTTWKVSGVQRTLVQRSPCQVKFLFQLKHTMKIREVKKTMWRTETDPFLSWPPKYPTRLCEVKRMRVPMPHPKTMVVEMTRH